MTAKERLAARLEGVADAQLDLLLGDAEGMLLACTGRSVLPDALVTAQVQLAAILYNRQGTEGETAHSEGGVSRTAAALPDDLRAWLNCWRLARTAH